MTRSVTVYRKWYVRNAPGDIPQSWEVRQTYYTRRGVESFCYINTEISNTHKVAFKKGKPVAKVCIDSCAAYPLQRSDEACPVSLNCRCSCLDVAWVRVYSRCFAVQHIRLLLRKTNPSFRRGSDPMFKHAVLEWTNIGHDFRQRTKSRISVLEITYQ